MKFAAVFLLAFVASAIAGPTSISDNNVGDIITVGIKADLKIKNEVDQTLVNVIGAYLNRQSIGIGGGDDGSDRESRIPPELRERIREWLRNRGGDDDGSSGIRDRIRDRIRDSDRISPELLERIREWLRNRE
jgi:hypothetical protein